MMAFDPNIENWSLQAQIIFFILLGFVLLAQSIFIFKDAQKRKVFPWFWGFWGLIQTPTPLIVYYFVVMRRRKKVK